MYMGIGRQGICQIARRKSRSITSGIRSRNVSSPATEIAISTSSGKRISSILMWIPRFVSPATTNRLGRTRSVHFHIRLRASSRSALLSAIASPSLNNRILEQIVYMWCWRPPISISIGIGACTRNKILPRRQRLRLWDWCMGGSRRRWNRHCILLLGIL